MIVLGANSDISQAFIEKYIKENNNIENLYLVTSNLENLSRFEKHLLVKYNQKSQILVFDLTKDTNYKIFENINSDLLFCASGFLGKNSDEDLYSLENTNRIIEINYSKLVPLINYFAQKFEQKKSGTIIALSSVAGERGRQSNFIYGSAKAGFTTYLQGLRNYLFHKNVHVLTVIPGFMATKMTMNIKTPKALTSDANQVANMIFSAYKKKKNVIYVSPIWQLIMFIIKLIPEFIFKKMKM